MTDPTQIARELLPCLCYGRPIFACEVEPTQHAPDCPASRRPQVAAALTAERDACEAELKEQRRQLLEGVIVIRDLVAERDSARNSGICAGLQIALDIAQERVENGPCGEYCRAACDIRAEIMGKGIPPFKTPERAAVGEGAVCSPIDNQPSVNAGAYNEPNPTLDELRERVVATADMFLTNFRLNCHYSDLHFEQLGDAWGALQAAQTKEGGS